MRKVNGEPMAITPIVRNHGSAAPSVLYLYPLRSRHAANLGVTRRQVEFPINGHLGHFTKRRSVGAH